MSLGNRNTNIKTYDLLDRFITILGSTKTSFWPFLESDGAIVGTYKENAAPGVATDAGVDGLQIRQHIGGVNSTHFDSGDSQHILVPDEANLTIAAASGVPMSIGCWFYAEAGSSTLISKYDTNDKREYKLSLDASVKPVLELYDENIDKWIKTTADTGLSLEAWHFVVATFDGTSADETDFELYAEGASVAETGSASATFVAVEDLTADFVIGGDLATGSVTNFFDGSIALPFICGSLLSAANVLALYNISKTLLGV